MTQKVYLLFNAPEEFIEMEYKLNKEENRRHRIK